MCTIVILRRVHPSYPLVIAANRDEFYARLATGPRALQEVPRVVGGVDSTSGGTWMGVNAAGFFVGITNQRTFSGADRRLASRGPIVRRALELGSSAAVRAMLRQLEPGSVNSFNLLYGDCEQLEVAYLRREQSAVEIETVEVGVHVLANDRLGSADFPKAARAQALIGPHVGRPWNELRRELRSVLADHHLPPAPSLVQPPTGSPFTAAFVRKLHALCVHTEHYGTRSATLLALTVGSVAHYEFAEGAPCTAEFADHTALLEGA